MTSILILTDDEPSATISQQAQHDVVIELDADGNGYVVKNRHGVADYILPSDQPNKWRNFIQIMATA